MIVDERMRLFINSMDRGNPAYLETLATWANENDIPIIRREMQSFLRMFLTLIQPETILEVGAAVGFSSLLMSEYAPRSRITTIENYEKRIPIAQDAIRRAGREERITLLAGDASEILPTLEGPYDLIFMDAAKGQYPAFLPHMERLLHTGGVLISDNVLQDGDIIESHYAVERRNRTIYKRMRDYLYELTHSDVWETSIIPIGDGITVSVRR